MSICHAGNFAAMLLCLAFAGVADTDVQEYKAPPNIVLGEPVYFMPVMASNAMPASGWIKQAAAAGEICRVYPHNYQEKQVGMQFCRVCALCGNKEETK